jgi:hypothetical protein
MPQVFVFKMSLFDPPWTRMREGEPCEPTAPPVCGRPCAIYTPESSRASLPGAVSMSRAAPWAHEGSRRKKRGGCYGSYTVAMGPLITFTCTRRRGVGMGASARAARCRSSNTAPTARGSHSLRSVRRLAFVLPASAASEACRVDLLHHRRLDARSCASSHCLLASPERGSALAVHKAALNPEFLPMSALPLRARNALD